MPTAEIHGFCEDRFAPVRAAIEHNFQEHGELGAAVAIEIDGKPVVDVWAGWMDASRTRPWQHDTLVDVFSIGKTMAALCLLMLAERGQLDLDAPIARYWPEFAAAGKETISSRMVLAHRAGLPAIRKSLPSEALYEPAVIERALAGERPWWEPDTTHGYHVNTFGFLVAAIVRRVSGSSLGKFFQAQVAEPLGVDLHFGVPASDDVRIAEYLFDEASAEFGKGEQQLREAGATDERRLMVARAYFNPAGISGIGTVNTRDWRAAEIPSANAHATARAVARVYSALAAGGTLDGVEIVREPTIEEAISEASAGEDYVLARPSRFGLGFQLTQPERQLGPNPRAFGHFGAGGSLGFADPDEGLAFAYAMNRSGPRWQNPRNRGLIDAVYASL